MLDGGGVKLLNHGLERQLSGGAVVFGYAHLDEAMGIERSIGLVQHGLCQAVGADHDDGIKMMGCGAMHLAFSGSQYNLGHGWVCG